MTIEIRPVTAHDEDFLWEMLYYAAHADEEEHCSIADLALDPILTSYVVGWGKAGDLGFVAVTSGSNMRLGAAWVRLPIAGQQGYSYLDDQTPELAVAVLPAYRGQGIGGVLMERLVQAAHGKYSAIILSVRNNNPAKRFYQHIGFVVTRQITNRVGGQSSEMILPLAGETAAKVPHHE
jgi:ribosomal protein S18 acetylase RimI-like enzyme